jgi:hypothetical protein
MEKV